MWIPSNIALHLVDLSLADFDLLLDLLDVYGLHGVLLVYLTLHTLHVSVGVLVAMLNLEFVPNLPEQLLILFRVTELGNMGVDRPRTVDLSTPPLQLGKSQTDLDQLLFL